jgi:hypothetical protein
MLSGLERGNALLGVIGDGGIDVDGINIRIREKVLVRGIPLGNVVLVSDLIEGGFRTLTDRCQVHVGVMLINWDKLGTEAKSYDCDIHGFLWGN